MRPAVRSAIPILLLLALAAAPLLAQPLAGLRGPTPLDSEPTPAAIPREVDDNHRQVRGWPEQPPVIPHKITGHEVTLNANRCLTCHGRQFTAQSGAPMISVTHFQDRDGQILAAVSPRRYFCTQCHIAQFEVEPVVENRFEDVDMLLARARAGGG